MQGGLHRKRTHRACGRWIACTRLLRRPSPCGLLAMTRLAECANLARAAKGKTMATNRVYRIAVIPGDGIGKEVMPEGVRVLEAAAKKYGFELRQDDFDFASYDYY